MKEVKKYEKFCQVDSSKELEFLLDLHKSDLSRLSKHEDYQHTYPASFGQMHLYKSKKAAEKGEVSKTSYVLMPYSKDDKSFLQYLLEYCKEHTLSPQQRKKIHSFIMYEGNYDHYLIESILECLQSQKTAESIAKYQAFKLSEMHQYVDASIFFPETDTLVKIVQISASKEKVYYFDDTTTEVAKMPEFDYYGRQSVSEEYVQSPMVEVPVQTLVKIDEKVYILKTY